MDIRTIIGGIFGDYIEIILGIHSPLSTSKLCAAAAPTTMGPEGGGGIC